MLSRAVAAVKNPAQLLVGAFAALITVGTVLLMLPMSADGPGGIGFDHALFTSTSATTVTGLTTVGVDEWSLFGELVILGLIQVGGFGIMTIGSVLLLLVVKRLGLKQRMLTRTEIGGVEFGEVKRLVGGIAVITVLVEAAIALIVFLRLWQSGAESVGRAAYSGVFHSISAFNNAGIALYSDSMERFGDDPVIVIAISVAFIFGGLGFPVILEITRRFRMRHLTLHARITLGATAGLLIVGPAAVLLFEWANSATLGDLDVGEKLMAGWFQGTTPRTAGFNTVEIGDYEQPTLLVTIALMFIGSGPASTSGGIKITTFALLGYVLWSELRGDTDVNMFRRRIPPVVIRQAIAVVLLSIAAVVTTTLVLLAVGDFELAPALFESTSAFGTVGLSTGITDELPTIGEIAIVLLMFAGRVGPVTLVTALTLRHRTRLYHYPEERPIIG